ncbi:uncharacterized protein LOC119666577 [Teleopsis dalmanni]|uniref:uncharacterized protein LOC119666577 n=1 Tax=Teleopsis dalmanni TaxID=139649 RepID=UPI0018CD1438|nr:uncharacterized protein LOC119666577 [Teleopsis dalmanni]
MESGYRRHNFNYYPESQHLSNINEGGKHKNTVQDGILLGFMELHKEIATGFVKGDKVVTDQLWAELTGELNSHGPPSKDIQGWKKVWLDWKATVRKKIAHNNSEARATGGGPFNKYVLTAAEKAIGRLCGIFKVVRGIENTVEFGQLCSNGEDVSSDELCLSYIATTTIGAITADTIGPTTADTIGGTNAAAIGTTTADAIGTTTADTIGTTTADAIGTTTADAIGTTTADAIGTTTADAIGGTNAAAIGSTNAAASRKRRREPTWQESMEELLKEKLDLKRKKLELEEKKFNLAKANRR